MSWSAHAIVKRTSPAPAVFEIQHVQTQEGNGEEESKEAVLIAKEAVLRIVGSGKLGVGTFDVHLSGHANTGNEPTPGWGNDFISINITKINPGTAPA